MQSFADVASKPVFVFTGMGPLWWAMGQELLEHEPVFRKTAEKCDAIFQRLAGWSILAEMSANEDQSQITSAHLAQPANFILQAGLTALWRDWGVEPAATIGHSQGEVAAAYAAGVLDLPDAVRISYHLGRLLKRRVSKGAMLAVGLSKERLQSVLASDLERVCIAAVNSPSAVTLAGDPAALDQIASRLNAERIFNRFLHVDVAYHSHHMEPLKSELREALKGLRIQAPVIPLYSTVTGRRAGEELHSPEYWCDNTREPVLFETAIGRLIQAGHRVFLQIGPHPVLSKSTEECLAQQGVTGTVLGSLRRGQPERKTLLEAREALHRTRHAAEPKGLSFSAEGWNLLPNLAAGLGPRMSESA
jgi:acyl transferase domain-containing protein